MRRLTSSYGAWAPSALEREFARQALQVQDACNLTGVALSFARAVCDLREHLATLPDRPHVSEHPVTVLWVDKLASLAGCQDLGNARVMDAFAWAHDTCATKE